ncbi:deoxyribose-phosphate aldolase [candidate division WOR-3 bacterium]|nr:deoxyribose-phosphate aldolase [candidate division WOR-3 bacterium]
MKNINSLIDHTNLKPAASEKDILKLCEEALKYNFRGVCVNPIWISLISGYIKNKSIKIISVCDFPLGSSLTAARCKEAELVIKNGAEEIDVVLQIPFLKSKKYKEIERDIEKIVNIVHPQGTIKVIIEAPILSDEEILSATAIAESAGADFIKSGTGTSGPVTIAQIRQIKRATKLPIKAAGGIKNIKVALELIKAGARVIGSSRGKEIVKELSRGGLKI